MGTLTIDDFKLGLMRDRPRFSRNERYNITASLYDLINFDIDYETGGLIRRRGYADWAVNIGVAADRILQMHDFIDTDGNEYIICLVEIGADSTREVWAVNVSDQTTEKIHDGSSSMPTRFPAVNYGKRVFFGTSTSDDEWRWADSAVCANGASDDSYQVGIDKPAFSLTFEEQTNDGTQPDNMPLFIGDATGRTELNEALAQSFQLNHKQYIDSIMLHISKIETSGTLIGNIKIRVYPDNAGEPDETEATALSGWSDVVNANEVDTTEEYWRFSFDDKFWLEASTTYWVVLDGDDGYDNSFSAGVRSINWSLGVAYANGKAMVKSAGSWADDGTNDYCMMIGSEPAAYGGNPDATIGDDLTGANTLYYKWSLYNDTYGIESPLSDEYAFTHTFSALPSVVKITEIPSSFTDGQVTHVRLYRRIGTTDYNHLFDVAVGATSAIDGIQDAYATETQGASTFQRLQDKDEAEIAPAILTQYKSRIWAADSNDNIIYMSQRLEDEGILGQTGDAIPDVFHADNKYEFPAGESIKAMKVYHGRLYVYFANQIWLIDGCDSSLNPPDDLFAQLITTTDGVIDGDSIVDIGAHILMTSNKEVKAFDGSPVLQEIGDVNQSLFDTLSSTFRAVNYKTQWWCGVDTDGDGDIDEFYIYDMSHDTKNWRRYQYDHPFNDIVVTQGGVLLAASTQDNKIFQLDTGTTDDANGDNNNITSTVELHEIIPSGKVYRSIFHRFEIDAYFPSTAPTITATLTDREGNTQSVTCSPSGSTDYRELRKGIRGIASEGARLKLVSTNNARDKIRSITLHWR